jgi:phosphate transport system substrate-binding protein
MPANDGRQHHAHRTPRITLSAGAAVAVLAITACTSTATSSAPRPTATGTAAATSGPGPTLSGAGSTFDAPFFDLAFSRYHREHPAVTIGYSAVGSSAGIAAFSAKHVDFGATDVPLTTAEQAAAHGGPSVQVPVDLGAEVLVYNLVLPGGGRLHLTGPVIARIFLGQITSWADPAIVALNPHTDIPRDPITVVHRSDGSGTTYIFTDYLSRADPAWASRLGTGRTVKWPVGVGAEGNAGVGATVFTTPFSIGYVERSYSHGSLLAFAAIRNQAGRFVTPSTESIAADAAQKPNLSSTNFSIVNEPGQDSYPISGYSWALIYTHQASQASGQALVNLMDWLTHTGQAYAAATSYVPLPPRIQQLAHSMLQHVTGPHGTHLLG